MEQVRGSSTERGYDAQWRRFVVYFRSLLAGMGIIPCCGASLPTGPDTTRYSKCRQQGLTTLDRLHLHHDPPLLPHERKNPAAVCDVYRVAFVCVTCHSAETALANRGAA